MTNTLNTWTATERAAQLAAQFANGELKAVADELTGAGSRNDAIATALLMGAHLSPAKRVILAELVLEN